MHPLSRNAREYILGELLRRAGLHESMEGFWGDGASSHSILYEEPDHVRPGECDVIIVPCSPEAVRQLITRPPASLRWLPESAVLPPGSTRPLIGSIPALLWGAGRDESRSPFVERRPDGCLVFNVDIAASSFFMLTRWEETLTLRHDQHDRFPASESVAFRQGFLDRPIVDEYSQILGEWVMTQYPRRRVAPSGFSVLLSHDIDAVRQVTTLRGGLRQAINLLLKDGYPWAAARTFGRVAGIGIDPYVEGIHSLASLTQKHHLSSVFNFMAARPSPWDNGYRIDDPVTEEIIRRLVDGRFEIGFHPSYYTVNDPDLLEREKKEFDATVGLRSYGGRQHYLRFTVPGTWRLWEKMGFQYDSTLGYADCEGFRAGSCWPYRPFDIELDRSLSIWEVPLIVMDATLRNYRGLTPHDAKGRILELARRCKHVCGTFTLLWHNTSFHGPWQPWAEMYQEILGELSVMHTGTISDRLVPLRPAGGDI